MTGDTSFQFDASGPTVNLIQAFNADGFQVGSDARVNTSGSAYHYVAWKATAGTMKAGSYAGNGADNRDITGAGFRPEYVILKSNGNDAGAHRPIGLLSDSTLLFTASANLSNVIQALQMDGFQVGSDVRANRSGTTYFWLAFGPEVDPGVSLLTITSVNGGANPTAGAGFPVTVQANRNVAAATGVALTLRSGTGTLGGTLTGTIPAGQSQVTISGVTYSKAESGVVLTANRTSGDEFVPGDSAPFTVNPGAIYSYTLTLSSPQAAGTSFGVTVTAKDQFANTVTTDNATVVTLSSSTGHVQFDSNGDGVFGDNSKMLNAGTFTINARDTVPENATISATDPNGKTGSAPVTINAAQHPGFCRSTRECLCGHRNPRPSDLCDQRFITNDK